MDKYQIDRKLFHAGHYNIIAKQFREALTLHMGPTEFEAIAEVGRNSLTSLALSMTRRFMLDNTDFDPIRFLDACSPDPELMPMGELWDDLQVEIVKETILNQVGG